MGYQHYWSRRRELDAEDFANAAQDIQLLIEKVGEMGLQIAGPTGEGQPEVTRHVIAFNGRSACGHRYRDLGKPYAADNATGVEEKEPPYNANAEPGYSGPYLETRVCDGHCSAEPFVVDRVYLVRDWERPSDGDYYACSCETDFKPYDLLVTAALVRLKERLGPALVISSENPSGGFEDAKRLCRQLFGFTSRFEVRNAPALAVPGDS